MTAVHAETTLLAVTSPEINFAADRMGLTQRIEASGALVLSGVCFYQSYAREMAGQRLEASDVELGEAREHHRRIRYKSTLGTMEGCVDSAVAGRIV